MANGNDRMDLLAIPMVFIRIGWMDRYRGLTDDEKIVGGGAFVQRQGYGFEIFNFHPFDGHVYGFGQPPGQSGDEPNPFHIERLGASKHDESVSGVLVVWVAARPAQGATVIVGRYRNATVYRHFQLPPAGSGRMYRSETIGFNVTAAAEDAVLLSPDERLYEIPLGRNGMGQSNVWYADNPEVHHGVRSEVIEYIVNRQALRRIDKTADGNDARQLDPLLRSRIERAAIEEVTQHFQRIGYTVRSVERDNVGWDLEASHGNITLRVEVKGLSGSDITVELTPNEYARMQEHRESYRLCVVTNALNAPRLSVFGYSNDSGRWEDRDGVPLNIDEIIGARCRCGE